MDKKVYIPPRINIQVIESEFSIAAASINLDSTEGRIEQSWEEQEIIFDLSDWGKDPGISSN